MAKEKAKSTSGSSSIMDMLSLIGDITGEPSTTLFDDKNSYINDYISTGNYMLNAQLTGSIWKGIPEGRIIQFAGSFGTGKTYICMNTAREAQKKGYFVIWFDTEGAMDTAMFEKMGCDTKMMALKDTDSIESINKTILNILDRLLADKNPDRQKYMFVIDSVGAMNTEETVAKATEGSTTRDMSKQKIIKKLFTTIASKLKRTKTPMLITNHTYLDINSYVGGQKVAGGTGTEYMPSATITLSKAQLKKEDESKHEMSDQLDVNKTGIVVTSKQAKARYTKAGIDIKFHISFYRGMNRFVGIEPYLDFDLCGVGPGKYVEVKEETIVDGKKVKTKRLEYQKDNSDKPKYYAVKHLEKHIPRKGLFSPDVLPKDVLDKLDENVIRPVFEFPDYDDSLEALERVAEEMFGEDAEMDEMFETAE